MTPPAATKLPTTSDLLEVLVELHGKMGQTKYAYSARIAKYGVIGDAELRAAGTSATEKDVWKGQKASDVSLKLAGALTEYLDAEGDALANLRRRGMSEGSLRDFLGTYARLKADGDNVIGAAGYHRDDEMANLQSLMTIFSQEIFDHPDMDGLRSLKACMKSKWWKECHRVAAESVAEEVFRGLDLGSRPTDAPCYTPAWTPPVRDKIREVARRWRESPLWDATDVDFTSNNERTVKDFLTAHKFTSSYLEGR